MTATQNPVVTILKAPHICLDSIKSPKAPALRPTASKRSSPRLNKNAITGLDSTIVMAYRKLNPIGSRARNTPKTSHFQNLLPAGEVTKLPLLPAASYPTAHE